MRGMMGGFYKLSEWIMRLAVVNVMWLICGLPFWIVTFFGLLQPGGTTEAEQLQALQSAIVILAVVSPFTFFPATSAMFSVARKWVLGDVDVPLFKTYFRSYKANFKQAMLGGILYSALGAILIIDYQVYLTKIPGLGVIAYLFIALIVLLLVSLHHFFSLLSHFHMKTMQLLKNALVLTIGRPIRSIMMTVGTFAILYVSTRFTFLIPFFFGSLIAAFTFFNFNQVITKMLDKAEEMAKADRVDGSHEEDQEMKS